MSNAWEDIKKAISDYAPAVAAGISLIPGAQPVGAAVGLLAKVFGGDPSKPDELAKLVENATPEQKLALVQEQNRHLEELSSEANRHEEAQDAQDTARMQAVNATMQAEIQGSANEKWYQKAWRPACGFAVAIGSFAGVLGVCLLFAYAIYKFGMNGVSQVAGLVPSLAYSVATILGVPGAAVGIAAYQRGKMKRDLITCDKR